MTLKTLQIVGDSTYGGASYLLQRWCDFLAQQGCEIDVLARDPVLTTYLRSNPRIRIVDHIEIPRDVAPFRDFKALIQLLRLLRDEGYSVVHTYTSAPGFLGRWAARLAGVPVILHHQAGWVASSYSSFRERLLSGSVEYLGLLASTKSICVSHATCQQAIKHRLASRRKLIVICNGIDPRPFMVTPDADAVMVLRRNLRIPSDHFLIGNTGRLARQKDNETLIRSLVPLRALIPDVPFTLLLAGDGPERQRLECLVDSMGLNGEVKFLGFLREIPLFLGAIDLFVSSSLWEGLSISLLEAMAAAKPIIATSIAPNAELIEHEVTGLLVPPRSPDLMARAIARIMRDPELGRRCGLSARERTLAHYTIDRMLQMTWNLYVGLLQSARENSHQRFAVS